MVLNHGKILDKAMLPKWIDDAQVPSLAKPAIADITMPKASETFSNSRTNLLPLWQIERDAIMNALRICDGNVTRAAAHLEIGASTLYRKKIEFEALMRQSA